MLIAAERTLVDGCALPGLGLSIDSLGRVRALAPLSQLGQPTHLWPGHLLVPGLVDVYAPQLGALLTQAESAPQRCAQALTEALLVRRSLGVTTVGVPLPGANKSSSLAQGQALIAQADVLARTAQRVGVRVAMLSSISAGHRGAHQPGNRDGAPLSLDESISAFEQLVHHLLCYRDPQLSWALLSRGKHALPLDALMSLRLRLSHLPCLIEAAGPDASDQVRCMGRLGLLDACTAVLDAAGLDEDARRTLIRFGAWHVQGGSASARGPGPPGAHHAYDSSGRLIGPRAARMSAHSRQNTPLHWPNAISDGPENTKLASAVALQAATSGGTKALGLRGGALSPGSWADLFMVPLNHAPLSSPAPGALNVRHALAYALAASGPRLRATWMLVGGREVASARASGAFPH